ncbi:MAG: CBS domain-containing protein [Treponema sp.]|nr:CBS domain-containing protein [Treponema sp.]
MLVSRIMTRNPICVDPEMNINEVRSIMSKEKISHLPVLDKNNIMIGLMTKKELVKAGPSPATSLDMYEISYLLSKLTVKEVMVKKVVTVEETEVVEEAARIMADQSLGCLPVMRDRLLVGIITNWDLLHGFVNALGARHKGVRITFNVQEKPGQLAMLSQLITEKGWNIVSLVTFEGDDLSRRRIAMKIGGSSRQEIESIVKTIPDLDLEDIRE